MTKGELSVLIASESAEEIKLITKSLRSTNPGCRVEAVYSADETLDSASRDEWSVILLDEALTRQCGRDMLPELKRRVPSTRCGPGRTITFGRSRRPTSSISQPLCAKCWKNSICGLGWILQMSGTA